MYIQPSDTEIELYPLIVFPNTQMNLVIIHKPTKKQVNLLQSWASADSGVTLTLPDMATIQAVAKNLDEIVVRVFNPSNTLYYEGLYRWVTDSPNILLNRKAWTKTSNNQKEWLTI